MQRIIRKGVKLKFIAEVAGLNSKTLDAINSGRRVMVTTHTIRKLDLAIDKIESGRVVVPDSARRALHLPVVYPKHATHCIHGHEWTPENTRYRNDRGTNRTRVCKQCETKRMKRYRINKAKKEAQRDQSE